MQENSRENKDDVFKELDKQLYDIYPNFALQKVKFAETPWLLFNQKSSVEKIVYFINQGKSAEKNIQNIENSQIKKEKMEKLIKYYFKIKQNFPDEVKKHKIDERIEFFQLSLKDKNTEEDDNFQILTVEQFRKNNAAKQGMLSDTTHKMRLFDKKIEPAVNTTIKDKDSERELNVNESTRQYFSKKH